MSRLSAGLGNTVNPRNVLLFFCTTAVVAVFGNGCYEAISGAAKGIYTWQPGMPSIPLWVAIGAFILWFSLALIFASRAGRTRPDTFSEHEVAVKRGGLVVLLSTEESARVAIDHHLPSLKHLWILYSEKTKAAMEAILAEPRYAGVSKHEVEVTDVFNIKGMYTRVLGIYADLPAGLTESDVVLDFTGMTKQASIGAVLACHSESRSLEYVELPVNGVQKPPRGVEFTLASLAQPLPAPSGTLVKTPA